MNKVTENRNMHLTHIGEWCYYHYHHYLITKNNVVKDFPLTSFMSKINGESGKIT